MRRMFFVYATSLICAAGCASSASRQPAVPQVPAVSPGPAVDRKVSTTDPRFGLRAGWTDAAQALWNMRLISNTPATGRFAGATNSDLAFTGNYAIQGNYNGYQVWDISNPEQVTLKTSYFCPASQSDVSVYRNLLFVSGEGLAGRIDCHHGGVIDSVSPDRLRGIRIFDISDIGKPRYVGNVQTCRGSHTHTVAVDPKDADNVYIYISGSASVRSPSELPGCLDGGVDDPTSARFRIEVVKVPVSSPQKARIVSSPRIFSDLISPAQHGGIPAGRGRSGPNQCHDITVYPAIRLAGGACEGYGLLLDIRDIAHPRRIEAVADSNFSYWHSATFNNDGTKVLFSDEWGGGSTPRCRATDRMQWGADAVFTLVNNRLSFASYYKLPAAQGARENCVAHNGGLIPIPGRDVMVQAFYQGGITVFDWTDPYDVREIAYFDRGPMDSTGLVFGGSWSAYWYNGVIVSSETGRGLDILELTPNALLTRNEIDAARTVHLDYLNAQGQPRFVWPATFSLARAYIDQLRRNNGLAPQELIVAENEIRRAESLGGDARWQVVGALASRLRQDANGAPDPAKVNMLASALAEMAKQKR